LSHPFYPGATPERGSTSSVLSGRVLMLSLGVLAGGKLIGYTYELFPRHPSPPFLEHPS